MKPRILVIDDDAAVLSALTLCLESEGYEVIATGDGERGIAAYGRERPDLVLTDIVMPVKEGLQTIREIRREWPQARIIALSGGTRGGQHNFLDVARELGAQDVVAKPFDLDDLLTRVRRCLDA